MVELATDNLASLPDDWVYEYLGVVAPPSVYDRAWPVMSLAQLGRFAEAPGVGVEKRAMSYHKGAGALLHHRSERPVELVGVFHEEHLQRDA